MKEFMFIFINNYASPLMPSPEKLKAMEQQWKDWIEGIDAKGRLASPGNRLGNEGKMVKPNNLIIDGPFTESKEVVGGLIVIKATSLDEAAQMAGGCPILGIGGSVEVRNVIEMPKR